MRPLWMHRAKGIKGALIAPVAFTEKLVHGMGNAISVGVSEGVLLGPEIVINGDASNGTSNWTAYGPDAPGAFDTQGEVFRIRNITANSNGFGQPLGLGLTAGRPYRILADINIDLSLSCIVKVGTALGASETWSLNVGTSGRVNEIFTADANSAFLSFENSGPNGTRSFVDNISVREILV